DLAEVAVFQGPRAENEMFIGPAGEWNDTVVPRLYYMDQMNYGLWHLTDAEARAGIDGLILGSVVGTWRDQMKRLRLSQLLEMYYSDRGVNFDTEFRACERYARYTQLLAEFQSDMLEAQTTNFARVLSYNSPEAVQISDEKLQEFSQKAVSDFNSHLPNIVSGLRCETYKSSPRVHLNVVLDGTWTRDEAIRVLAQLAEDSDVCYYGSSLAIMNGEDASWILRETRSAFELFKLHNKTDNSSSTVTWPSSLNLRKSLGVLYSYLADKVAEERRVNAIGDLTYVILVLGYSATISNEDFDRSVEIIQNYKSNNPDVRFVYLASEINQNRYKALSTTDQTYTDDVIVSPNNDVETVVPSIVNAISKFPGRLISAYCQGTNTSSARREFEDYITPGHSSVYRIHPQFLINTARISLYLTGSGYGDLNVCISREESVTGTDCQELKGMNELTIHVSSPCLNYAQCPPLYITISATSTTTRCSEDDCRFPDQVRFVLRHEGLNCAKNPTMRDSGKCHFSNPVISFLFPLAVVLFYSTVF
ncbi:hypothetical protein L9F63_018676, partial [Diploptera punctata]